MLENYINTKDSFQVFLEERNIPDPDELLGKALKYLKEKGKNISFKGFDIDNSLYRFDKCFGLWQSAKFTKVHPNNLDYKLLNRKSKIESYYS